MQPVRMTQDMIRQYTQEFYDKVSKMHDIRESFLSFEKIFNTSQKDAVEVNFTTEAYEQMMALIRHFDSEVAWHGLVNRIDETHFQITKILVYPQKVTGVTVDTDYEKYQSWLYERPDEEFNTIRFQGHSHVNMGVTPSAVDIENQWGLINNLDSSDFYIFMIWNKRCEYNVRVVDMKKNVIYSGSDVKVTIGDFDSDSFLKEADSFVEKPTYNASYCANGTVYAGGAFTGNTKTDFSEKEKKTAGLKTVVGAAAPKVNTVHKSNLKEYYNTYPEELEAHWNSSCAPYID